jgi:energy-coupling factor transporter ATP-binding protein EcfA2
MRKKNFNSKQLIVITGLSSSGKSTFINNFIIKKDKNIRVVYLNDILKNKISFKLKYKYIFHLNLSHRGLINNIIYSQKLLNFIDNFDVIALYNIVVDKNTLLKRIENRKKIEKINLNNFFSMNFFKSVYLSLRNYSQEGEKKFINEELNINERYKFLKKIFSSKPVEEKHVHSISGCFNFVSQKNFKKILRSY